MPIELAPDQIAWVIREVEEYILAQRKHFAPQCRALNKSQLQAMRGFFPEDALAAVRIAALKGESVENPAFYKTLRQWGVVNLLDFEDMAAITLVDVIVSHEPFYDQLLFHELVHVMQYRFLGPAEFAKRYVQGFLSGGCYENIPLEMQAYELEGRFGLAPDKVFSVEEDVKARLQQGSL